MNYFRAGVPWGCALLMLSLMWPVRAEIQQSPEAPRSAVVQDPHYGDALFHFYQERYFSALTLLMASQHFERVAHHADEAELLRGGLLLAHGLHADAADIFTVLAKPTVALSVRNRAWYQLAQMRYQRGLHAQAEQALTQISSTLPADLEPERQLLQAQLRMIRGDFAGAASVLEALAVTPTPTAAYARYNLGVAFIQIGEVQKGQTLLDALGRAPADSEELRSLRDKANLALGFAELQSQNFEAARDALERVRLNATFSAKALLGLGWASAGLNSTSTALVPWTELLRRDPRDPAVLEAHLAVPYALAELGASAQALHRYEQAVQLYDQQRALLDESINAIRNSSLMSSWLEDQPVKELGAATPLTALPEALPHAAQLGHVWAQHEFQSGLQSWRDLHFLHGHLQQWQDRLGTFSDMLTHRRQAYEQRLPKVLAQAGAVDLPALQQRSKALLQEVAAAAQQPESQAFADDTQTQLLQRARRVHSNPAVGEEPLLRERLRRVQGALTWQLAQQHPARSRQVTQMTHTLEAHLQEAQQRQTALIQAQRDEPARFAKFEQRIQVLSTRLQTLVPRVSELRQAQEAAVRKTMVEALEQQKERLVAYTSQAQLAMAQLLDRASIVRSTPGGRDADRP